MDGTGDCCCCGDGDCNAIEEGYESRRLKERAPVMAPSMVFLVQLLVVSKSGGFGIGVGGVGDEDGGSVGEELQSESIIFVLVMSFVGWLEVSAL